jgi:protease-4
MANFFKIFFASFLALLVFTVIGFVVSLVLLAAIASPETPTVGKNAVLVLDMSKLYKEQAQENPFAGIAGAGEEELPGLYDMVRLIKQAATNDEVKAIYIKASDNVNGFAASEEIRNALIEFKQSKKMVIAYGEMITQKAYYVAQVADKVYVNPKGFFDFRGFASSLFFIKGSLEKLDIEPQIFYAGKFKSATEPLREYKMTEANKLQTSVYLGDLYQHFLAKTAEVRNIDTIRLHQLANTGAIQTPYDALQSKLIDGVRYDDEVKSEILLKLGLKENEKINYVSFSDYQKARTINKGDGTDKIAVIYAEGDIVDGYGDETNIGSDRFRNIIRKARLDKSVKAVVLRVNSPGGSALASEVMWRELTLTKKVKPVIISMGDVAASGGYYIACGGDSVFAQPNTITGSIGVFGIIPNMQSFFKNKLGITFDGVKTANYADFGDISRPLNPAEKVFIQNSIDSIYYTFKSRVADARNMTVEAVDSIAQGRVWTGKRAVSIGLVDKLGSLNDAINCAARMAKTTSFRVKEYPEQQPFFEKLFNTVTTTTKVSTIKKEIGTEQYDLLMRLTKWNAMMGIPQARMPFELDIK